MTQVSENTIAQIASAYFGNHQIKIDEIALALMQIRKGLTAEPEAAEEPMNYYGHSPSQSSVKAPQRQASRQEIARSLADPDWIVSFIDGRPMKTLTRHIKQHGYRDAHAYRQAFGLPNDYPMTARNYSEARSALAKAGGLGRKAA